MRILFIGGTGFIGSAIVRMMAAEDHVIAVYHRGQTETALPAGVRQIVDRASVMPIVRFPSEVLEFRPDVLIHTVAMGEADAQAAVRAFRGHTGRMVLLSSGDVYLAYGRFTGIEPGPPEQGLLSEESPLRTVLFPYRADASSEADLRFWYEKILAERAFLDNSGLTATVLRLPKVYGPAGNADLATIYRYRNHGDWRWTHGYVENVAAAVSLAATHPSAAGRIYNIGEEYTPTIAERLRQLPPSTIQHERNSHFDFRQNIAYDTSRIRIELGYREIISEQEGLLKTLRSSGDPSPHE